MAVISLNGSAAGQSDGGHEFGERPWHVAAGQRIDQYKCVPDLAIAAGAHEPTEQGPVGFLPLRRLSLKLAIGHDVALRGKDLFYRVDTESGDQFVLEIRVAHEEPLILQLRSARYPAQPCLLETGQEEAHLGAVTQTGKTYVQSLWPVPLEKVSDVGRTVHGKDSDTLGQQVATPPPGQRRHRELVADPLDQDHCPDRFHRLIGCRHRQRLSVARGACGCTGAGTNMRHSARIANLSHCVDLTLRSVNAVQGVGMWGGSMTSTVIISASAVITMDPALPRAKAVALDTDSGTIISVGSLADCRTAAPGADEKDLGDSVVMPGFIEAHSHPFLSGIVTQSPTYWIAPYVGYPTWDDVTKLFAKVQDEQPPGATVLFNGLDRLLQQVQEPDNVLLDRYFPDRPAAVFDNSGHEVYFNSAAIALLGWTVAPPDPAGARYGRNPDGTSNGRAYETAALLAVAGPLMKSAIPHPLYSAAQWYTLMAKGGITTTTDMSYSTPYLVGYEALAAVPDCPLRISLYHMSTENDADKPLDCRAPDTMIRKQGIKLWADGSPWVGTAALSYPYVDSVTVRNAGIPLGPAGESAMNYSREQLDQALDRFTPQGWQMAFHVNGDVGLDVVLDAYQRALSVHDVAGTDHRWRVEHLGGARADQFARVASLGVFASLGPFQFIYWGDLLDGELFSHEIGAQWMRFRDAVDAGLCVSFHNDGSVSPPVPLLNIQAAVTRMTLSGRVHGPEQAIGLDAAFAAQTIDAARTLHREHEIGSITPGKLADFVELSADPWSADPARLVDTVTVNRTWRGGRRIDPDAFLAEVRAIDPTEHQHLAQHGQHC